MQNLNPFSNSKTIPYHRLSREFSENDSDHGEASTSTSATLAPVTDYSEKEYLINRDLHRSRRSSRVRHTLCYVLVVLLSMLVGLVLGELFRVEYEIDGYVGAFLPYIIFDSEHLHRIHHI